MRPFLKMLISLPLIIGFWDGLDVAAQVTPGDFVSEFVTSGNGGLSGPSSLVFGPDNNLYVTSQATNSVIRYDGITGFLIGEFFSWAPNTLEGPEAISFGPDGNLYVAVFFNLAVVDVRDGQTGESKPPVITVGNGSGTSSLTFGPNGNLYASDFLGELGNNITQYSFSSDSLIEFVSSGSGGLDGPTEITFGPDENLYVASFFSDQVLRYNGQTGDFIDEFVASGSGGLDGPVSLSFGPDNNLYVANLETNSILRYNGQTGDFIDEFVSSGSGGLDGPSDIAFGPNGDLYVSSANNNAVMRYAGPLLMGSITFQVDMSREMRLNNINFPAGEIVGVRGNQSPLEWTKTIQMLDVDGDSIFVATVEFALQKNTEVAYKYVKNIPGEDPGEGWEGTVGVGELGSRLFRFDKRQL